MEKNETIEVFKKAVSSILEYDKFAKENYRKYQNLIKKHPLLLKKINDVQSFCKEQNENFNINENQIVKFGYDLCVYKNDESKYYESINITTAEGETYYRNVTGTSLSCIADECHSFVACYLEAVTIPAQKETAAKFCNNIDFSQIENLHISMFSQEVC